MFRGKGAHHVPWDCIHEEGENDEYCHASNGNSDSIRLLHYNIRHDLQDKTPYAREVTK